MTSDSCNSPRTPIQPMERKNIYFISDLHLGATYLKNPRSYEQRVVRWLESIRDDAAELYMLGDILDYWYEYKTVVPRGYIRFFGALASLADSGVKIYWFIGNHDIWLFDYLKNEIGLTVIDGWITKEIAGKKFFMSHGDGLGKLKPTFRLMRGMFRNKVCQKLYSAIHPRWTIPFALNWSSSSRNFSEEIPQFAGAENESLITFASEYSLQHPDIDYFVFGHRHILIDYPVNGDKHVIILGDWIHHFSFGKFDGKSFELYSYTGDVDKKSAF